jgi:hypothetical protein
MEGLIRIKQGNDDVCIQQGAHGLHAFLVLYSAHVFQRDHLQHSSLAARLALRLISGILTLYEYSLCDWPTFSE